MIVGPTLDERVWVLQNYKAYISMKAICQFYFSNTNCNTHERIVYYVEVLRNEKVHAIHERTLPVSISQGIMANIPWKHPPRYTSNTLYRADDSNVMISSKYV